MSLPSFDDDALNLGDDEESLDEILAGMTDEQIAAALDGLPPEAIAELTRSSEQVGLGAVGPDITSPMEQAQQLDDGFVSRSHLDYLSERLAKAVEDVEDGENRTLVVSMPPRMGKSQLTSVYLPLWILHKHPTWKIGMMSHSPNLATSWGRQVRRAVEEHGSTLGVTLARDAGAVSEWETSEGGGVLSRSMPRQSVTGFGFKVMLIDDPVKDFANAHSENARDEVWEWWKNNGVPRLEAPYLVVVIGTRWHTDDMIGRLLSHEYEGNPDEWEEIRFPALATGDDVLGRSVGDPLYSPINRETREQALRRWAKLRELIGSYAWAGLYQQEPAPAQGAVFDNDWWRFWTRDPEKTTDDGKVVLLNPLEDLVGARWIDSWDTAFKETKTSDYVVGQRWARLGKESYLIEQKRDRWGFTGTIEQMREWSTTTFGSMVYEVLIEDKANGSAIIETLKNEMTGIVPITPKESKESRARAITPEIESGHVFLPHPDDPGNQWVTELLTEVHNFPAGSHDDQVDPLTQVLNYVRGKGGGGITVPGRSERTDQRGRTLPTTPARTVAAPRRWHWGKKLGK